MRRQKRLPGPPQEPAPAPRRARAPSAGGARAARSRPLAAALSAIALLALVRPSAGRLQVVLDTDVGLDIDDAWALSYILAAPHVFDLRLVTTASGDTSLRAQVVAKLLTLAGHADVPIGVGADTDIAWPQDYLGEWAADMPLRNYSGRVGLDGVALMADVLSRSAEPTIIAIGPFTNLQALVQRFPEVAQRTRVYAMGGSIRKGYGNRPGAVAEYNVKTDVRAAQLALREGAFRSWFLSPLDSCGVLQLAGERYQRLLAADRGERPPAVLAALLGSYRAWYVQCSRDATRDRGCSPGLLPYSPGNASTVLWDALPPIAMALQAGLQRGRRPLNEVLEVADMKLCVTDEGLTVDRPDSSDCAVASVALGWRTGGLDAAKDELVAQLLGEKVAGVGGGAAALGASVIV